MHAVALKCSLKSGNVTVLSFCICHFYQVVQVCSASAIMASLNLTMFSNRAQDSLIDCSYTLKWGYRLSLYGCVHVLIWVLRFCGCCLMLLWCFSSCESKWCVFLKYFFHWWNCARQEFCIIYISVKNVRILIPPKVWWSFYSPVRELLSFVGYSVSKEINVELAFLNAVSLQT